MAMAGEMCGGYNVWSYVCHMCGRMCVMWRVRHGDYMWGVGVYVASSPQAELAESRLAQWQSGDGVDANEEVRIPPPANPAS